jgi:hypothetical protein
VTDSQTTARGAGLDVSIRTQLHPTRNPGVDPLAVTRGSTRKLWWLCPQGHEYETTPGHRARGQGCPYCAGRRALAGFNDLATVRPDLAAEWDVESNGDLTPEDLTAGSAISVWWLGVCGHSWQARVNNRVHGTGCPICAGQTVLAGFNDLATVNPGLAAQWDIERNGRSPDTVSTFTSQRAWWVCDRGHSWEAQISNRANGNGCPVCAGQLVVTGLNDMATTRPDLAAEFDLEKNHPLDPSTIFAGVARKLWWRCTLGHEWVATGNSRASSGTGCPVCAGQRIEIGFNDLATVAPDVAATWHPTRNAAVTPQMVTLRNGKKFWWQCELGHEWITTVASRTSGNGCPTCAGQIVIPGLTDLATLRPDVAATWHPTRNGALTPGQVAQYSNRIFWWQCEQGHEWESTVNNRTHGQGCPGCAERGYKPTRPGYVYFLHHQALAAFKVGITNVGTTRLALFQEDGWDILNLELFRDGAQALAVETAIKRWWRKDLGLPAWLTPDLMSRTGGWSETISDEALGDVEILKRIKAESAARRISA